MPNPQMVQNAAKESTLKAFVIAVLTGTRQQVGLLDLSKELAHAFCIFCRQLGGKRAEDLAGRVDQRVAPKEIALNLEL
jgi:hypothetical protein